MSTELEEMRSLFSDPKSARKAWKAIGAAIAARPASTPIVAYDRDGNPTVNSLIEQYSYNSLVADIKRLGSRKDNRPTELEMIMACQMVKARTDTAAATFVRDTLGAKPVDESKIDASVTGPYESLTDEELALIAEHRKQSRLSACSPEAVSAAYLADEPAATPADGQQWYERYSQVERKAPAEEASGPEGATLQSPLVNAEQLTEESR